MSTNGARVVERVVVAGTAGKKGKEVAKVKGAAVGWGKAVVEAVVDGAELVDGVNVVLLVVVVGCVVAKVVATVVLKVVTMARAASPAA